MANVPVALVAMAWADPMTSETIILLFHQGLWFGDKLPSSLINPNQGRVVDGIEICDDLFNQENRSLGIDDENMDCKTPMEFGNSVVFLRIWALE